MVRFAKKRKYKKSHKKKGTRKIRLRKRQLYAPFGGRLELKYKDHYTASTIGESAASPPMQSLTVDITQGNDNVNRQGRKIHVKSVWLKLGIKNTTNTDSAPVRFLLVHDMCPNNGTVANLDAIIDDNATVDTNAFPKVDNQKRFKVLWEHHAVLGARTAAQGGRSDYQYIEKFLPVSIPVCYSGNAGTAGELVNGAILLYCIKDGNVYTGYTAQVVECQVGSRIRYLDM